MQRTQLSRTPALAQHGAVGIRRRREVRNTAGFQLVTVALELTPGNLIANSGQHVSQALKAIVERLYTCKYFQKA